MRRSRPVAPIEASTVDLWGRSIAAPAHPRCWRHATRTRLTIRLPRWPTKNFFLCFCLLSLFQENFLLDGDQFSFGLAILVRFEAYFNRLLAEQAGARPWRPRDRASRSMPAPWACSAVLLASQPDVEHFLTRVAINQGPFGWSWRHDGGRGIGRGWRAD